VELSTKGRYAVMALADIAAQTFERDQERNPVTLADIAHRQEISQSYLEQLFARLRRAGLVASARGPGGGYWLAKTPAEISVAEVMNAVEEPLKVTRCDAHMRSGCLAGNRRCMTHDLWDELSHHIGFFLNEVSLADVINRNLRGKAAAIAGYSRQAAE
jgi:Rrf2 family transcriptional regulator, iron-sulfur cluster assembly transcription factor